MKIRKIISEIKNLKKRSMKKILEVFLLLRGI